MVYFKSIVYLMSIGFTAFSPLVLMLKAQVAARCDKSELSDFCSVFLNVSELCWGRRNFGVFLAFH